MNTLKPRPTGVNLQPAQKAEMLEMYKAGATTAEIARHFNVNKSSVSRLTLRAGLREPLAKAGKKLTEAEISDIKLLYKTTYLSKQVIADKVGVSYDSVHHHTKDLVRVFDKGKARAIVELYLAGEFTADEIRIKEGITKKKLYALIREFNERAEYNG